MDVINAYFNKRSQEVSFIELKQGSYIEINGYLVEDDIPLPIVTDTLIKEIREGGAYEEIKILHLIEGVIYILGIDPNFKYKNVYRKMLHSYDPKIEDYILYRGFELIQDNNYKDAIIYFRALSHINNENINGVFNYALCLEKISEDLIYKGQEKEGKAFLIKSTNQLESILDLSPEFPLSYYKLGFHYKYYEQFLKAKLIWEKYMKIELDKDNEKVQEIREQIEAITDDVEFEEGLNYLTNREYELALDKLLRLAAKYEQWWNIFYLTGLAYKGLGQYENAIDFFYEALELEGKEVNIYNELGICLFGTGNIKEAIKIFNEGIEFDNTDYKIIFNRGLAYLQLGLTERAIDDIDTAYKLNPNDIAVKAQKKSIDRLKDNIEQ